MFLDKNISLYNIDNLVYMQSIPDQYFDWVVADPPYGLGKRLSDGGGKLKNTPMSELYRSKDWDVLPTSVYWSELFRVSKNQIIFGANYFLEYLGNTRGFVCWDKKQALTTLSACELIWTSLDKPAKIATYSSTDLNRFHPTQKPIEIYKFMFDYCRIKKGAKIFDPNLGSCSSVLAAVDMNFDIYGCEVDKQYFDNGIKRVKENLSQLKLF